jgi:hypothetical protein
MADAFTEFSEFLTANERDLRGLLQGGTQLLKALQPKATEMGVPVAALVGEDQIVVRQIADAVGLAEIAGQWSIDAEDLLDAALMIARLGGVLTALV